LVELATNGDVVLVVPDRAPGGSNATSGARGPRTGAASARSTRRSSV